MLVVAGGCGSRRIGPRPSHQYAISTAEGLPFGLAWRQTPGARKRNVSQFLPPLLMILFRQKYPRWWFDWNLQLLRFSNRVAVYLALMDDHYPSTDEQQAVHLDFGYPDAREA
jgi:hypothetical protein